MRPLETTSKTDENGGRLKRAVRDESLHKREKREEGRKEKGEGRKSLARPVNFLCSPPSFYPRLVGRKDRHDLPHHTLIRLLTNAWCVPDNLRRQLQPIRPPSIKPDDRGL